MPRCVKAARTGRMGRLYGTLDGLLFGDHCRFCVPYLQWCCLSYEVIPSAGKWPRNPPTLPNGGRRGGVASRMGTAGYSFTVGYPSRRQVSGAHPQGGSARSHSCPKSFHGHSHPTSFHVGGPVPAVAARTLIAPAVVGACGCRVFLCPGACLQVLGLRGDRWSRA